MRIGIRHEDKSIWERRVPITPDGAARLIAENGLEVVVQSSPTRVFPDREYRRAGAVLADDISSCPVVLGVKEMPAEVFRPGHTYVFFAHVIKGQSCNMAMLRQLMDLGCQLIDYERITDERGRRLVFFGRYAGLAGMIDTLWALGKRLDWEGVPSPFSSLRPAHQYAGLGEAERAVAAVGEAIASDGLPDEVTPLVCGFAGYGNVFRGANQIIELLPVEEIAPDDVETVAASSRATNIVYKVVFKEEYTVRPRFPGEGFELQRYYDHPERFESSFAGYLPHLSLLVNCVYWEAKYPRLVTKLDVERLYRHGHPRLRVIGDISCDIEGAIECTVKSTDPGDPVYVYEAATGTALDGVAGCGPVIMAVDILPSELPRESSIYFSGVLAEYIPGIAGADFMAPLEEVELRPEIRRALIVHQGELTPDYGYLREFVGA